jgi:hypothetical protein
MAGESCRQRCYRESVGYMGRCRRCAVAQCQEGRKEKEIVWETYQGETSRSVVSRAREHYNNYRAAMKKPPPARTSSQAGEEGEEGSSWLADHARSHHGGVISNDPCEDYDFLVLDQWRKSLLRQLEEAVRIKQARSCGHLMLGRGPRARRILLNPALLNRKMENFSPWFLTLGGGD